MAVVVTPNLSSVKIKYDLGTDLNGDRIVKYKTYSSINYNREVATLDKIVEFVNGMVDLQQHTKQEIKLYDYASLSE